MSVIKDLGITDLNGKITKPRRYYECSCDECKQLFIRRADRKQFNTCDGCSREKARQILVDAAIKTLEDGVKHCSQCKQLLPLAAFGTKSQMLTGFRSICKECRYEQEKETAKIYANSIKRKLVSANSQSKRREIMYKTADNSITSKSLQELKAAQNNLCGYCGCSLKFDVPKAVHLDHIIPLSKGGTHTLDNIIWACSHCNLTKSSTISTL